MRIKRITISAQEVLKQKEPEFQKMFTKRLIKAGFNLKDPIIRQPRNDIEGADFIQLRYSFWDRFDLVKINVVFSMFIIISIATILFFLWQMLGGFYLSGHPDKHIWFVPDTYNKLNKKI